MMQTIHLCWISLVIAMMLCSCASVSSDSNNIPPINPVITNPTRNDIEGIVRGPFKDYQLLRPIMSKLMVKKRFPWRYVVWHHSATANGNATQFDIMHKKKGWKGLGYHFVIGNGYGCKDGEIEVGFRWPQQIEGAHAGSDLYNRYGIGICLVGDFQKTHPTTKQIESLVQLTKYLLKEYHIPVSNVVTHQETGRDTLCPGRYFPVDTLRSRLRTELNRNVNHISKR